MHDCLWCNISRSHVIGCDTRVYCLELLWQRLWNHSVVTSQGCSAETGFTAGSLEQNHWSTVHLDSRQIWFVAHLLLQEGKSNVADCLAVLNLRFALTQLTESSGNSVFFGFVLCCTVGHYNPSEKPLENFATEQKPELFIHDNEMWAQKTSTWSLLYTWNNVPKWNFLGCWLV